MKVTFILPDYSLSPVGGFRIVYTYANALANMGHEVTLIFPNLAGQKALLWVFRVQILRRVFPPWYDIQENVSRRFRRTPTPRDLPDADAIIATGVQTADFVANLPQSKGAKFYLVQHLEDWIVSPSTVRGTWRLPMVKLAISKWLYEEILDADPVGRVRYLPNPFDLRTFYITVPPESRDAHHVTMMWSPGEFKRAQDGVSALKLAHIEIPELRVTLFGTVRTPSGLPSWIEYVRSPHGSALRELYNQSSIFLHTSSSEGFGLPPGEAMACGAAVVATRNQGVLEYLDEGNAVLVDVGDIDGLAAGISSLVQDRALRLRLVDEGKATVVAQRSTDDSARQLETILAGPGMGAV
jgi:glycosyltransferase involved in cell wall biosynthesis